MSSALHERRVGSEDLFQSRKLVTNSLVHCHGGWVPPAVGREAAMEHVEPSKILDIEMAVEMTTQLRGLEEMEASFDASSIVQLDVAAVFGMIPLEPTGLLDGIDEDGRHAAD